MHSEKSISEITQQIYLLRWCLKDVHGGSAIVTAGIIIDHT